MSSYLRWPPYTQISSNWKFIILVSDSTHCESRHAIFRLSFCASEVASQELHVAKQRVTLWTASLQSSTGWNIGNVVSCVRRGPRHEVFTSENHNPGARIGSRDLELKTVRERVDRARLHGSTVTCVCSCKRFRCPASHLQFSFSAATQATNEPKPEY